MEDRSRFASYLGYLLRRARILAGYSCSDRRGGAAPLAPDSCNPSDGAGEGSPLRELAILLLLAEPVACSQQQVAGRLGINRSVMVKLVDALEARGEVVRSRNQADRRSYVLEITAEGRARSRELLGRAQEASEQFLEPLSKRERSRFVELMAALVVSTGTETPPAALLELPVWLAIAAFERMEVAADAVLEPLGIDLRTYIALAVISSGRFSQSALATHMMIGSAATVDLVDELEREGAVRRVRSKDDRRSYSLEVTEKGQELASKGFSILSSAAEKLTVALDDEAEEELTLLLARITESLPDPL